MKKMKVFTTDIMKRYVAVMDNVCIGIGEFLGQVCKGISVFAKYILTGLVVLFIYLLLAATMPVWYLPYKYFIRKGQQDGYQS